jgi:hypothetical protein
MTLKKLPHPHEACQRKTEEEYKNTLAKEVRDFMRNGDPVILKRVLFKMFVNYPIPQPFKQYKANAVMLLMLNDTEISSAVTLPS